jgi:cytochrome c-type biogenesis protein CcmE
MESNAEKQMGRRPSSRRRRRRLTILLLAVIATVLVVFWGWSSTGGHSYINVAQIANDSQAIANGTSQFSSKVIEVKGVVTQWYGGSTFTLVDPQDSSKSFKVNASVGIPQGFENGKEAVVKGKLRQSLPLTMDVTGITVGCASKY